MLFYLITDIFHTGLLDLIEKQIAFLPLLLIAVSSMTDLCYDIYKFLLAVRLCAWCHLIVLKIHSTAL